MRLLIQMFYNPILKQFTVPPAAGISFSFTDDMYFEMAKVEYDSNCTSTLSPSRRPSLFHCKAYLAARQVRVQRDFDHHDALQG